MGRDLGRAALMRGRVLLLGALLAPVLATVLAAPALAADPTPGPTPSPFSTPSVSPPSEQQIQDARNALDRLRNQGKHTASPTTLTQVAAPTAGPEGGSVASRISDQAWWTIGAGLLVLVVASEATRISVRRAKHRRGA